MFHRLRRHPLAVVAQFEWSLVLAYAEAAARWRAAIQNETIRAEVEAKARKTEEVLAEIKARASQKSTPD